MVELTFTPLAKDKYEGLTGSQRYFVDQGLDDLKRDNNDFVRHVVNTELGMTITFERNNSMILVTDILHDSYQNTQNYQDSQKRMNDWNN